MSESNDLHGTMSVDGPTESGAVAFHEGRKYRRKSIIIGVIGLFLFGIVAGVVAFIMAGRAEAAGVKATAGKILGVLDIVGGIIVMVMFFSNR